MSSVEDTYNTTCPVRMLNFRPVWTGSCKPDPGIQRQMDAAIKRSLVSTGSAVGALVGTAVLPGLGTVVGKSSFVISTFSFSLFLYHIFASTFFPPLFFIFISPPLSFRYLTPLFPDLHSHPSV